MKIHDQSDASPRMTHGRTLPGDLVTLLKTGKIPNALLFVGNPGLGKGEAALSFARALNCLEAKGTDRLSCDQCRSCKKMLASMHPDIICVDPCNGGIKIPQIREIYGLIKGKPHVAKFRMVLIQGADTMNPEASNALLKILEEPPDRTFFVLTAEKKARLLPTILSRCRQVTFFPINDDKIYDILVKDYAVDKTMARVATSWSHGSLQKALQFAGIIKTDNDTDWSTRRKWFIPAIAALINANTPWSALLLSEKLSRDPELLHETMAILESFLRDIIVLAWNSERIVNSDFLTLLHEISPKTTVQRTLEWINELHETEKKIKANTGIRLTLEAFLFKLMPAGQLA